MRKPAIASDDAEDSRGVSRALEWVALLDLSGRDSAVSAGGGPRRLLLRADGNRASLGEPVALIFARSDGRNACARGSDQPGSKAGLSARVKDLQGWR
jgi:hypothetical protein